MDELLTHLRKRWEERGYHVIIDVYDAQFQLGMCISEYTADTAPKRHAVRVPMAARAFPSITEVLLLNELLEKWAFKEVPRG